jgi:hypothetical protein
MVLAFISSRQRLAGWTCVLSWTWAAAASLAHAGDVLPQRNVTQAKGNYGQAAAQIASAALTGKSSMSKMDVPSFCFMAGTRVQTQRGLVKIESLRVGGWVLADESEVVRPTAVRAGEWRRVEFTFADPHSREGKPCRVVLLRSAGHVAQRGWRAGAEVKIDFGEEVQRAEGRARIVSITAAAAPEVGAGQVVTGTFQTWHRDLRELWMEGLKTPVRVTSGHRFYSASREAWVEAHHLRVGETVRTRDGAGCRVRAVLPLPGEHEVFNIEVETAHQYHVTTAGLLTHNNGGKKCETSISSKEVAQGNEVVTEAVEEAATHGHHTIPRQVRKSRSTGESMLPEHLVEHPDIRGKPGNPNVWDVPAGEHIDLHKKNREGGDYNSRWKQELGALEKSKPKAEWEAGDITGIRDKLTSEFDIEKYRPQSSGKKD